MKKKKIKTTGEYLCTVALDASLNESAITVFHNGKMINYWAFTNTKSLAVDEHVIFHSTFKDEIERLTWLIETISSIIIGCNPKYVAIEDYAFGAKGRVFHIGGFVEGIKMKLYEHGIEIRLYDPPRIKQFTTGKGNADKSMMALEAYKKFGIDFGKYGQISNNLVDSYCINELLNLELKLKGNRELLKKENKTIEHIFTHTTKSNKIPLIDTPFIKKRGESRGEKK